MILVAAVFALTFALLALQGGWEWRRALMGATTVVGALVVASSELLGRATSLDADRLFVFWATSLVAGLVTVTWFIRAPDPIWRRAPENPVGVEGQGPDWILRAALCFLLVESLLLLLIALLAPFDNWDSMTYHLSRVEHWRQEKSIAFFPTDTKRELHLAPWSEWFLLQMRLLSGSDRGFGLAQWLAFVLTAVSASYAAKQLGGGARAQVTSAVAVATIPMGVLQATSTQNDMVAAMWASIFFAFVIDPFHASRAGRLITASFAGLSLGLGVLTKLSVVFFLAPLACWILVRWHREIGSTVWAHVTIVAACVALVNAGHLARNQRLYGSPLGPESAEGESYRLANEVLTPGILGSNLVRNLGIHLMTPFDGWNRAVEIGVSGFLTSLGLDPDDPRSTYPGERFRLGPWNREDCAGNPVHLLLLSVCLAGVARGPDRRLVPFAICLACGMVLFAATAKWQPFHSRIHLPWFVLAAPFLGLVLERRRRWTTNTLWLGVLGLVSLPYLLVNPARPLVGGASVLRHPARSPDFRLRPELEGPLRASFEILRTRACRKLGIVIASDEWEYPIWSLAAQESFPIEIQHVAVRREVSVLVRDFRPCAVLALPSPGSANALFDDLTYERALDGGSVALYLPSGSATDGPPGDRDQSEAR